jgi:hypothetical protein
MPLHPSGLITLYQANSIIATRSATPIPRAPPHDAQDRRLEPAHLEHVAGDRLGLPALLGADAGIGAGGVNQGHDGQPELLRQLHAPKRLSVPFGVGQAEEALHLLLGSPALVVPDQHYLVPAETGEPAFDRGVVAVVAIAVQLAELATTQLDIVLEQRPLRVAGNLDGLPRREVLVGLAEQAGVVRAELAKLFRIIHLLRHLQRLQLVDLQFEFGNRLFEIQHVPQSASVAVPVPGGTVTVGVERRRTGGVGEQ